ncbi:MAG: organomercurial lyase [bacterium]
MAEAPDFDTQVKLAIYGHFAEEAAAPTVARVATRVGAGDAEVQAAYRRLFARRVLVLEPDGATIRMAPPFSGVPTQHVVLAGGKSWFANCAWDALGVLAALGTAGEVRSRCEQTMEPLRIPVDRDGPSPVPCVIHFAVPAAHWWRDIVYT